MDQISRLRLLAQELSEHVSRTGTRHNPLAPYVSRLLEVTGRTAGPLDRGELEVVARKIEDLYPEHARKLVPKRSGQGVLGLVPGNTPDLDNCVGQIATLVDELVQMDEATFRALAPAPAPAAAGPAPEAKPPCVFIGHGRSKLWAVLERHVEKELGVPTTEYESAGRAGKVTVAVLEEMLDKATFAILVLTADDETADGGKRARQNVVHEAGLFQGRLGFDKAVLMIQDGVEEFSNIHGLQHIKFAGDSIEGAFHQLRRAMEGAGVL